MIVGKLLGRLGFEVLHAADGIECMDRVVSACPDLILLDERIPGLRGNEVIVRLHESGAAIPIVLITAATDAEDIAQRAGTPFWLRKPFGLEELTSVLAAAGFPTRRAASGQ